LMKFISFDGGQEKRASDNFPSIRPGGDPHFSPDGKWVTYDSQESSRSEIYAARYPTGEGKIQISTKGGDWPIWSANGKEIFFVEAGGHLAAAEVRETSTALEVSSVKTLFELHQRSAGNQYSYDATPDGKRFLVIGRPLQNSTTVVYVNDWLAAAKK
jgi:eukaryotic-like serine/threonine-protein kinase